MLTTCDRRCRRLLFHRGMCFYVDDKGNGVWLSADGRTFIETNTDEWPDDFDEFLEDSDDVDVPDRKAAIAHTKLKRSA